MQKTASLLFVLIIALFAKAQSYSIYQNITTSNGLPSNYVFASSEDENGFLWVGTDKGLCRYDGFRWQVWDKDNGLPGNYVSMVLPDKRGGLWIYISDKGYFHFDQLTGTLQPLVFRQAPITQSIQTDKEGNFYVEVPTEEGYSAYLFRPDAIQKPENIFEWKGNLSILLKGDASSKQVRCLSASAHDLKQVKKEWKGKWPLRIIQVADRVYKAQPVYHVSDSVLITSTEYFLFASDGQIKKHQTLFPAGNSYAYTYQTDSGLYVYNIKTGYYFFNRNNNKTFYDKSSGLGTDYVNHVYQTSDGTIIISTLGAGLQLIKNRYRKTFFTDNNTVKSLVPSENAWYVLAGNKVYKTTATTTLTALGEVGTSSLNLVKWGDTLIAGTLRGVAFFRETKSALLPLGFLELTAGISSVMKNDHSFLAGTFGSGLFHFRYKEKIQLETNYPFHIVEKLVPLSTGFAALSYEDGVLLTDLATKSHVQLSQKNGLLSNSVYSIYQRNDTLWIGTKGGISIYANGKVINTLRFTPGMTQEKAITSFHDAAGKFWVVSNRCLYSGATQGLRSLSSYPLITEDDVITTATYDPVTDELAVGSNKSFSIVSLAAISGNTSVPLPRLTTILLDDKIATAQSLHIPYDFNRLHFSLAPLSVLPFSQNSFYYKLEGLSNEWHELKDSLTISFTGLRWGSYTLLGKSLNHDGYESGVVQLATFNVQKPYWLRWPFLLFCVAGIVFITTLIVRQVEKEKRRSKETALLMEQTVHAERQRIAKDLHDHLGANLATIIAQTDHIETRLLKGDVVQASQTVQHLSAQTRETMNVLRETIWAVQETEHSFNEFLLRIRTFLQRFFEATGIEWEVKSTLDKLCLLSPAQTLHLFRIVQEASQNILKHSGASRAVYTFSFENNNLQMIIQDDGGGLNQQKQTTNGIVNIKERVSQLNGSVTFIAAPSVVITVSIPFQIR